MSNTYENMMTKGLASSLENTSVEDGKVRFTTDTNQLFIDADGERHEISDVMKKYTESEIKSLLAPLPKLYLSSDTHKLFVYASGEWIVVGKNDWIGTKAEYEEAVANGEILEGMTVYITDDYTGDGADLSIYCTYEYAEGNLVSKDDFSEISYPEYTEGETLETLTSGESIKTALSKLAHVIADYISHKADSISHITQEERSAWTAKLGTTDVVDNVTSTDANKPLSANQGKALNDAINTINSKNLTSYCVDKPISKIGWYRIARFKNPASTVVNGSATNSLTITIKRVYNNAPPEFHEIKFIGLYDTSEFRSIFNKSQSHRFTKIRHTIDHTNKYAYIEVYYNLGSTNAAAWFLNDIMDALGSKWEAIFESTEETVDGVTVKSSMDIPANDS